jgi:N utilization substance protein A
MDNKELLIIADTVSREKNIPKRNVLNALAEGMETALRKNFPEGAKLSVNIDENTGEIKAYRVFELVDQIEKIESEMLKSEVEDELVIDGFAFEPFEFNMNRQQYNITKQVALQKISQTSRENYVEDLLQNSVNIFSGTVKVAKKDFLIVDCQGIDLTLNRRNMLPRDSYKLGDKVFFTIEKEKNQYVASRSSEQYLEELFRKEIVYVDEGDIEIMAVARNPGFRAKVVVKSNVKNLDPVKACIGPKANHIKNIQHFLNGEFVDIIEYTEDPAQLLVKAFAPVNITNIVMDEDTNTMEVAVTDEEISQAIGKGGKNIELVSKLIGWNVNVVSKTEWESKAAENDEVVSVVLQRGLTCDAEIAQILMENGFTSLEEVAYLPRAEFDVEELDDETIDALRENAKQTLSNAAALVIANGAGELVGLGFSVEEMEQLQQANIFGNSEMADLAAFELQEILPSLSDEEAQQFIMKSRKQDSRFQEAA